MNNKPIPYKASFTFGRFNIPHNGHAQLVQQMLAYSEVAYVCVSSGGTNNDWDTRVLMFRTVCRHAGVDLRRVNFVKAREAKAALGEILPQVPFGECVIVLGSDQEALARFLSEHHDCPFILNRRTNSSTSMRSFIDYAEFEKVRELYDGNLFATNLSYILRKEELLREKSA